MFQCGEVRCGEVRCCSQRDALRTGEKAVSYPEASSEVTASQLDALDFAPGSLNREIFASAAETQDEAFDKVLRDNVKGILVKKDRRDLKMGVRLSTRSDGNPEGVEVVQVHPAGPLAAVVQQGDIVLRINGKLCNDGYSAAANELRDAVGLVEIVVAKPLPQESDT
jgi:hypothetical protein